MTALVDFMQRQLEQSPLPGGVERLLVCLQDNHGAAIQAVLLYGSCRRKHDAADGLVDLLVVVDSYRSFYGTGLLALLNWLLPPNVFYLESRDDEQVLRCKYAVISTSQFSRRVSSRMDHYFWARFCQPLSLVWARPGLVVELCTARARAAVSFARRYAPLVSSGMTAQQFWAGALATTYRCELRPESPDNARTLVGHDPDYWDELTWLLAGSQPFLAHGDDRLYIGSASRAQRLLARTTWLLRRVTGKLFNLVRLFKAAGTFSNGIDYIVWKVERHSGVRVEPTERMRRYPRLAAWGLAWRMWREGGFR